MFLLHHSQFKKHRGSLDWNMKVVSGWFDTTCIISSSSFALANAMSPIEHTNTVSPGLNFRFSRSG
jgi:hypothetical protein